MKIYTRIVIDMDTLETIEEDSYEYSGPVGLCMPGGGDDGGGDSGGSSGTSGGGASAGFGGASNPGSMGGGNTAGSGLGGFGGGPGGSVGGAGGNENGGGTSGGGMTDTMGVPGTSTTAPSTTSGGMGPAGGLSGSNAGGGLSDQDMQTLRDMYPDIAIDLARAPSPTESAAAKYGGGIIGGLLGSLFGGPVAGVTGAKAGSKLSTSALNTLAEKGYLGQMDGFGNPGGLSSGVGGGAGGPGDGGGEGRTQAYNYLSGLVNQNAAAGLGAPTSLEAIIKSMYGGNDPQFNLPQMMDDYTTRITDATDQFDAAAQDMANDWKEYEAQVFGIEDDYNQQMNNLPQLNMILPTSMGGGSVPLAPGAWAALAGDQASRRADILSQALPAMANRANIPMNRYSTQMGSAEALMRPFDTAMDIYELDKRIQGNLDVAEASKPDDDDGSIWDSLIPAAGYALGSWLD